MLCVSLSLHVYSSAAVIIHRDVPVLSCESDLDFLNITSWVFFLLLLLRAHLSSAVLCAKLVLHIVVSKRSLRDAGDGHCSLLLRPHRLSCNTHTHTFQSAKNTCMHVCVDASLQTSRYKTILSRGLREETKLPPSCNCTTSSVSCLS